jgi:hypothetical protein
MLIQEQKIREQLETGKATRDDILGAACFFGGLDRERGFRPQPLSFLVWMTNFAVLDEAFCRQIIKTYLVEYHSS